MDNFSTDSGVKAAREMAAVYGVEKTPREWRRILRRMIARYREWHPAETAGMDDREVWSCIREMVLGAS